MHYRKGFSFAFATVAGLSTLAVLATAQAPAPTPFMAHQLKPNVYWVEGVAETAVSLSETKA